MDDPIRQAQAMGLAFPPRAVDIHTSAEGFTSGESERKAGRIPVLLVDAWASLYDTTSQPFDRPETGKIAVKVITV